MNGSVTVIGEREVRQGLGRAAAVFTEAGLRRILDDLGLVIQGSIHQHFERQTAPERVADVGKAREAAGTAWNALSENTLAARRKKGAGAQILRDTGKLKQSIDQIVNRNEVRVGTTLEYGLYQHGGTDPYIIVPKEGRILVFETAGGTVRVPKVHHPGLPPRPFVGYDASDVRHMLQVIAKYLKEALRH